MALIFLFILVYAIIALALRQPLQQIISSPDASVPWMLYLQCVVFVAVSWLMYIWFEKRKSWAIGIKQPRAGIRLLQGLGSGIALMTLSSVFIWLFGGVDWRMSSLSAASIQPIASGFILFAAVAVSEELFSRGYVQGLLRFHYGPLVSVIVSSLLFALLHSFNPGMFDTPFPFINITLAGVLFALSREWSGGLWLPIGLHLTWNFFQGYVFGFQVSGTENAESVLQAYPSEHTALSGGAFGAEGSVITTLVLLAAIVACYGLIRRKNASPEIQA